MPTTYALRFDGSEPEVVHQMRQEYCNQFYSTLRRQTVCTYTSASILQDSLDMLNQEQGGGDEIGGPLQNHPHTSGKFECETLNDT